MRDRCLHVWAVGTVGLIHAYGPELVVFGGGVMRSGDIILPYIRDYASKYSWTPSGPVRILPAALGNHAGLLGAIPLLTDAASTAAPTARSAAAARTYALMVANGASTSPTAKCDIFPPPPEQ